jgi:hypothetical protein
MNRRALVSLAAGSALLLSAGQALAEDDDFGVRFRAGLGVRSGLLIVPGVGSLWVFGPRAQAGIQFNNFLGLYGLFAAGAVFGKLSEGTAPVHEALVVEFTFGNRLSFGVGPEIGWYAVTLRGPGLPPTRSGYIYGGRLHVVWEFAHLPEDRSARSFWSGTRAAFTVGLDVSLLGGVARFMGAVDASRNATANPLSFLPVVTIGVAQM